MGILSKYLTRISTVLHPQHLTYANHYQGWNQLNSVSFEECDHRGSCDMFGSKKTRKRAGGRSYNLLDSTRRRVIGHAVVQPMLDAFNVDFSIEETSGERNSKILSKIILFSLIERLSTHESVPGRRRFLNSAHTGL